MFVIKSGTVQDFQTGKMPYRGKVPQKKQQKKTLKWQKTQKIFATKVCKSIESLRNASFENQMSK